MGPRSDERGNGVLSFDYETTGLLQWGRVRMNAEIGRQPAPRPRNLHFNGAAFG